MSILNGNISIVIGSWGSYNECNERALGSSWLDLSEFNSWDEIEEELTKQGFKLDGIDEELFIQDIEGIPCSSTNWDYMNPQELFEILQNADVLDNQHNYDLMCAFIEAKCFDDFIDRVNSKGSNWTDDIYFYKNWDWEDYGRNYYNDLDLNLPSNLEDFIDFEAYGKYLGDCYVTEIDDGLIEIID